MDQLSRVLNPLRADPRCVLVVGALVGETVSVPQILCPALVGRSRELEASVRMLDAGCGGAVVVLGEAGIGKSRFIRELAGQASYRGLVIVSGRAVQSRQPVAYRPLAEALAGACRRLGLPADAELIPYRPALGRLVPEWHRPERDAAPESAVTLGEGVLRLVKALGGESGAVLVAELVRRVRRLWTVIERAEGPACPGPLTLRLAGPARVSVRERKGGRHGR